MPTPYLALISQCTPVGIRTKYLTQVLVVRSSLKGTTPVAKPCHDLRSFVPVQKLRTFPANHNSPVRINLKFAVTHSTFAYVND
ncbi:unnamed protein product [Fusarium graminearum]|uniref:Chromosome 1, complete genome n=1 Tax=Gibberella zeae (strain ATCC MYA-4620 / CBS 123657 / FGSC 9075 / NRRL 31084 / PH-1) TaxID=229533 RepID=A0A098D348_GIBZE|nr:unnamed protein product [Fusarium graminearum]CZS76670.1 unnamed protein product [Fusarium graminearum]